MNKKRSQGGHLIKSVSDSYLVQRGETIYYFDRMKATIKRRGTNIKAKLSGWMDGLNTSLAK